MKKTATLLLILLTASIFASDSATVLNFATKNFMDAIKVKSRDWMSLNAIRSTMFSLDSEIEKGLAKPEDYFSRGTFKQTMEDNYGALKDFEKCLQSEEKHFGSLVNRSVIYLKQKRITDALNEMNNLIKIYPDSAILYNNRGFLFETEENYAEAIKDYNKACDLNKKLIHPYVNKIRCYAKFEKRKEAKAACDKLQRIHPQNPEIYIVIANYYTQYKDADSALLYINKGIAVSKNNYEMYLWRSQFHDDIVLNEAEAIKDCDTAALLAPNNSQIYYYRARPLFDIKEYDKVISDCSLAISKDSTVYETLILRGDAYDLLDKFGSALKDYETAIRMYPYFERAYIDLETLYTSRKDDKNGIKTIDRLLKLDPENETGLMRRGKLFLQTSDFKKAEKDFSLLTKVSPKDPLTWYYLAVTLDSLDQKEKVCQFMKKSYELDLKEETRQHALASSHVYLIDHCRDLLSKEQLKGDDLMRKMLEAEKISDWSASILLLDKFLEIFPDSAFFYYSRGKNKRKIGDFEGAIVDYKKALKLNTNIPDAWISLGVAQQRTGGNNEAMESYKGAIKISPDNEMPYNNIGAILTDDKKYAEAIPYFKKAINIKADYITAIMQLGECYEGLGDKKNACATYKRAEKLGSGAAISRRMFTCN